MLTQIRSTFSNKEPLIDAERVYMSLEEAPVDDEMLAGVPDGNNALLEVYPGGLPLPEDFTEEEYENHLLNEQRRLTISVPRSLVVPLPRTLKKGMKGKDVLAVKRAAAKAGLRKWGWNFTPYFGKGLAADIKEFQSRVGLRVDGVYGPVTHSKMSRYFDSYGALLMSQAAKELADTPITKIVAYATFGYNKRYYIHYTQSRLRMYGVRNRIRPPGIPKWEDCSSFATWCYWGAGVKDPNGLGYNGYGYTGTLARNGWRVSVPKAGDLAFYGIYPHGHVVVCVSPTRCISHGNEYGPSLRSIFYRPVNSIRRYV